MCDILDEIIEYYAIKGREDDDIYEAYCRCGDIGGFKYHIQETSRRLDVPLERVIKVLRKYDVITSDRYEQELLTDFDNVNERDYWFD